MTISPAAASSLLSVNYCSGHWTTGVVIELLCVTKQINNVFSDLYTQNTQTNKKLTISLFYWEFFKNYTKFRRKRWGAVPSDHSQIPPSMIFESAPISIRFILAIFCKLLNTKFSLYKMKSINQRSLDHLRIKNTRLLNT